MKLALLALILICVAVVMFTTRLARDSLWGVVQACAFNHELTGAPFPCLAVTPASGAHDGYIVLRSPLGLDTIWSPTRRVIGLEDPALRGADAAGYFQDAWDSRRLIPGFGDGRAARVVVLAINSAKARSQDQLHIHMGCATPGMEKWAADAMPALSEDRWAAIDARIGRRQFWGRRVANDDLEGFNPFALTAALAAANTLHLSELLIAVIGIRSSDDRYHFLLIAGETEFGDGDEFDVKRLISRGCRS